MLCGKEVQTLVYQGLPSLLAQNFNLLLLLRVGNLRSVCRYPLPWVRKTTSIASVPKGLGSFNTCFLFLSSLTSSREIEKFRSVIRYPPIFSTWKAQTSLVPSNWEPASNSNRLEQQKKVWQPRKKSQPMMRYLQSPFKSRKPSF